MQCKDIPTRPILEFLAVHGGIGCSWYFDDDRCVRNVMGVGIPDKLVLAKMRKLVYKRLVSGCICGCRGDFELTEKGKMRLDNETAID